MDDLGGLSPAPKALQMIGKEKRGLPRRDEGKGDVHITPMIICAVLRISASHITCSLNWKYYKTRGE